MLPLLLLAHVGMGGRCGCGAVEGAADAGRGSTITGAAGAGGRGAAGAEAMGPLASVSPFAGRVVRGRFGALSSAADSTAAARDRLGAGFSALSAAAALGLGLDLVAESVLLGMLLGPRHECGH